MDEHAGLPRLSEYALLSFRGRFHELDKSVGIDQFADQFADADAEPCEWVDCGCGDDGSGYWCHVLGALLLLNPNKSSL